MSKNSSVVLSTAVWSTNGRKHSTGSNFFGGQVYIEKSYPNIIFAKDAEIYDIEGKKTLVIGGAYSIDKDYRLAMGYKWFPDEQPTKELKNKCMDIVNSKKIDIILSHTGPKKFEPVECFLPCRQNKVIGRLEICLFIFSSFLFKK